MSLTKRDQFWCDTFQSGVQQIEGMLPIVHAGDADRGMSVAMRHGDGYGRDARQGTLDRARICAPASRLADLVWDSFGFRCLAQKADEAGVVKGRAVCHVDRWTQPKLGVVAHVLAVIVQRQVVGGS